MKLTGIRVVALKRYQFGYTFLILKELGVCLHGLSHLRSTRHIQFLHTDGEQIGTEFLTVKLYIQQPVFADIRV